MISIAKRSPRTSIDATAKLETGWRDRFIDLLPTIRRHVRFAFRRLDVESCEEASQEATAFAYMAYVRLAQLGKTDLAYSSVLAKFGVARVRSGRSVGHRLNVNDVSSVWCQLRRGFQVDRLDEKDRHNGWREIVAEDRHAGPAETAAARIDFAEWLRSLSVRKREIAEALAAGHETALVARMFRVSPGRVSQLRKVLHKAWCRFHGEVTSAQLPAARRV